MPQTPVAPPEFESQITETYFFMNGYPLSSARPTIAL